MSRLLTILCDMDEILVALQKAWFDEYNRQTGDTLIIENVKTWDTHRYARFGTQVYSVLNQPGFYRNLPPIAGALEGIQRLHDAGDEIVILTAALSGTAIVDKLGWLEEHLPWLDRKNIIVTHRKGLVKGDVLIDDGPHNIINWRMAWGWKPLICSISYPYNQEAKKFADVWAEDYKTPTWAWAEIVEAIEARRKDLAA